MDEIMFEDADSGDEIFLEPDITYIIVSSYVELHGIKNTEGPVFTYRVRPSIYRNN